MTLSVIGSCYAFPHSLLFPLYAGMLRRLTLLGCCVSPLSLPLLSSCSIRFASLAVAVIVSSTAVEKVHVHRCVCILTADSLSFVFLFISPSCILPGMGQYIYIYILAHPRQDTRGGDEEKHKREGIGCQYTHTPMHMHLFNGSARHYNSNSKRSKPNAT